MANQRVEVDPGRYVELLEGRLSELTLETLRFRAALETLTERIVELEAQYQTDETGELIE